MQLNQDVEPLTLGTLGSRTDAQFQDAMANILERFQDGHDPADPSDKHETGNRKAKVTITIDLTYNLERRSTEMDVGVKYTPPKYRATSQTLRARLGAVRFLVDVDEESNQANLFTPPAAADEADEEH